MSCVTSETVLHVFDARMIDSRRTAHVSGLRGEREKLKTKIKKW